MNRQTGCRLYPIRILHRHYSWPPAPDHYPDDKARNQEYKAVFWIGLPGFVYSGQYSQTWPGIVLQTYYWGQIPTPTLPGRTPAVGQILRD